MEISGDRQGSEVADEGLAPDGQFREFALVGKDFL
jgi:hypothetical protein